MAASGKLEPDRYSHLTFDCYGTLIDWERGILAALRPVLARHGVNIDERRLLGLYAQHEAEQEAGPYRRYRDVLRGVVAGIAGELGFEPAAGELDTLPASVGDWPAFDDTVAALQRLAARYRLVVLSNIDDDLFAATAPRLGVDFAAVITAQQVGSYKPAVAHFEHAFDRLGASRDEILHVAQSLYHDHVPAKRLGMTTVWVNRASLEPGKGLSLPVDVEPDLEVPDLASLVAELGL